MSLKDAQKRLSKDVNCRAFIVYQSLNEEDQAVFDSFIEEGLPPGTICRILVADGHSIGDKTIRYHLMGSCACPPSTKHRGVMK